MIISRVVSLLLRGLEFGAAVIVLGLQGWLLIIRHRHNNGLPRGRMIYTEVIAAWSTLLSILWFIPFTWTFMHYPLDLLTSFAWFASFAALWEWMDGVGCQNTFNWDFTTHEGACNVYKTNYSFAIISGGLWLMSAILSCIVYHRKRKEGKGKNGTATAPTTA